MAAVVVKITGEVDDAAFKKLQTTLGRLGVEIEDVERKAAPAFEAIGKKMVSVGDDMTAFGKKWSTHVTAPLAALAAVSLKVAGDFEQTMNVLQVNSKASEKELASLRDMAIQFGQETVFSAGESADAMLELSKGGLSVAAIQGGALASTLNLAATEGMGLADAATIVVQAMNTFGLEADQTAKVVDVLAAGAVASTAGVEDLAAGLKYVGATAAQFKIGVGDSVTALAALNNAGLDSTTAGTSLNRFFLGLTGATKASAKAIKDVGMEFFDANGQMKPMGKIIEELEKGMAGLSDQERAVTLKKIFGVEGMRAGNILLAEGADGYRKLAGEIDKNGVAQQMADARMKGLKGSLEQLKGSMETAAIAIGSIMAPTIQSLAKFIQGLVDKFTGLPEPMQRTIIIVGAIVAAIGPLILVAGMLSSAIGNIILIAPKIVTAFSAIQAAAGRLFTFLLANPFVAIAAAVVVMAIVIYKNWDAIKAFLLAAWQAISDFATMIFNGIKDFFAKWGDEILAIITGPIGLIWYFIKENWETIKAFAVDIWNGISGTVTGAISTLKNGVTNGLDAVKNAFSTVFNGIKSIVIGIMNNITGAVKGAINLVIGGVNTLIRGLNRINFSLPSWIPGVGGKSFGISIPEIPALAKGGIVDRPTLALIGEAGPEAVVPLSSPQGRSAVGGVNIAPGAVQITINGPVDQSTLGSVERIVQEALAKLAREVSYA